MRAMSNPSLPIDHVLPELRLVLRERVCAVLEAPPGAGKTTRVPLALLDEPWLAGQKIIMLEPRRLAARAVATFMAAQLGEAVGETVGYRVRMESRVSARTRIEVVTEGVLTRILQTDPELAGVGLVIFDEFHERSLQADLGLALCLESQGALREDLRLLVMSATLDGAGVARLLGEAPLVTSAGRSYPVEVRYAAPASGERGRDPVPQMAAVVQRALREESGDVLMFAPGGGEISRLAAMLQAQGLPPEVDLRPLHGSLGAEAQALAIAPSVTGRRKVVLATNIAETSLTIDGIRVVIDSGLERRPRFDPNSGMTRLDTVMISQASAEQRRGRAGRLCEGVCYRLWPQGQHLLPHAAAEIVEADLAPLALELARWGCTDPAELAWLDPPPAAHYQQARELLQQLGATDPAGRVTAHGQRLVELPLHPRLAHMVLAAERLGLGGLGCELAAVLSERDLLRGREREVDLELRLRLLHEKPSADVDRTALQRVQQAARQWQQRLGVAPASAAQIGQAGLLLALAYPDRIAQRRKAGELRYLLSNGRGAALRQHEALANLPYLVVAELNGSEREAQIFLAAALDERALHKQAAESGPLAALIQSQSLCAWDGRAEAVQAVEQRRLGALVLDEQPLTTLDEQARLAAMLDGVRRMGLACLPWDEHSRNWQARVMCLRQLDATQWPDVSDEALLASLDEWLAPFLSGCMRRSHLAKLDLMVALNHLLDWDRQQALGRLAPSHVQVPTGSRIAIDYSQSPPVLAVRLQEMFGVEQTPSIADGRLPLVVHLLSPARRPLQVTQDLAGFWRGSYVEVKKEMKGRYPKHYWPDDPLQAEPTARAKPRR